MAKAEMKDFIPKLQGLCAFTLADNRSPEDAAEMIEGLISALAFTIALASRGDPKTIDVMCEGANHYLLERCVDHKRAGQVLGHLAMGGK
jgi:hypothetical protein